MGVHVFDCVPGVLLFSLVWVTGWIIGGRCWGDRRELIFCRRHQTWEERSAFIRVITVSFSVGPHIRYQLSYQARASSILLADLLGESNRCWCFAFEDNNSIQFLLIRSGISSKLIEVLAYCYNILLTVYEFHFIELLFSCLDLLKKSIIYFNNYS